MNGFHGGTFFFLLILLEQQEKSLSSPFFNVCSKSVFIDCFHYIGADQGEEEEEEEEYADDNNYCAP